MAQRLITSAARAAASIGARSYSQAQRLALNTLLAKRYLGGPKSALAGSRTTPLFRTRGASLGNSAGAAAPVSSNYSESLQNIGRVLEGRTYATDGEITRSWQHLLEHISRTPPTRVTTLPNGMKVATEEGFGETATVGVFIDAGSAFEDQRTNGVAHFLEHMAFKGTRRRTQTQLELEVENIGAQLNAYTSREQTVYYAKVFKNDIPRAVDILSDILQNSTFEKDAVERERSTILREMEEVNEQTEEVIFDHLHAVAYQGTSLGRTILGPVENIQSIKREDLVKYIQTHYTAPRMVLVGSGGVRHEQLVELATKHFGGLSSSSSIQTSQLSPVPFTGSLINIRDDDMESVHITTAVEGVGWAHPDYFAMLVLQTLYGQWDRTVGAGRNLTSNLCEQVATEGLAHSLSAFNTCYHDTGLFGVYSVSPDGVPLDDLMYAVLNEGARVANVVGAPEVERAKNKLKAGMLMALDGTTQIAEDIGRQILTLTRRMSPAEVVMRIDSVDVPTLKRVAQERLYETDVAVAAIGPTERLPDYNAIRGWTYWNRL